MCLISSCENDGADQGLCPNHLAQLAADGHIGGLTLWDISSLSDQACGIDPQADNVANAAILKERYFEEPDLKGKIVWRHAS